MNKLFKLGIAFVLLFLITLTPGVVASKKNQPKLKPYYSRILVKFKKGTSQKNISKILKAVGNVTKRQILNSGVVYTVSPKKKVSRSVNYLRKQAGVAYASPDYRRKLFYTPSDPRYSSSQWSLAAMNVPYAWDQGESEGWLNNNATVAVIDTGVDSNHPDLAPNLWVNSGESGGGKENNGIDDDGNGYIDDVNGNSWGALTNYDPDASITFHILGGSYPEQRLQAIAQTITGTGGKIKSLAFRMFRWGAPRDITVSIYTSSNNKPDSALGSFTIKASDVLNIQEDEEDEELKSCRKSRSWLSCGSIADIWVEKSFPSPITLSNDQEYFIVLSTNNASSRSFYILFANYGKDYYTGGNIYLRKKVGSTNYWTEEEKSDLIFLSDATGSDIEDGYGHGTSVSGVIGAVHNNAGGAGIVPGARIMVLKVSNDTGYMADSSLIEAINYAVNNGAKVINMSLGSSEYSRALQEATDYAYSSGVTVVASAGNDGEEVDNYPASNRNVISVGAMADSDELTYYSTLSDYVDVTAPGDDVYTTAKGDTYTAFSGTSAAAPQVSGLAALIRAKHGNISPARIISRVTNTATDLGATGRDKYYGHGQVNFEKVFGSTLYSKLTRTGRKTINYGSRASVTGLLKVGNWVPSNTLSGATINGYFKPHGFPLWLPFYSSKTSSNGLIRTFFSPTKNTEVRLSWDGNSSYQRANTEFTIKVRTLVYMGIKRVGKNVIIFGKVVPNHKGRVHLYRSKNGRTWKGINVIKLNKQGSFRKLIKPTKGRYYYRVVKSADSDHARGTSIKQAVVGR